MTHSRSGQVTRWLEAVHRGEHQAVDRLLPLVYDELRALAGSYLDRQRPDHTLQPTALVHEAYLRLADQTNPLWQNRRHFFNVAAMAMRQLLTDHARSRAALKRGGGQARVTLDGVAADSSEGEVDLVVLEGALAELTALDERQARIVELRFLAGLTVEETADVLGISPRTVKLDWHMARAWLRRRLEETKEG